MIIRGVFAGPDPIPTKLERRMLLNFISFFFRKNPLFSGKESPQAVSDLQEWRLLFYILDWGQM